MTACDLSAVGLVCPGIAAWQDSIPVFVGGVPYQPAPLATPQPRLLSASERRRATAFTKLALLAAEDAMAGGGSAVAQVRSVFASSGGDMDIIDKICSSLMQPDRPVSPTHFHNSIHNAAAGHWGIAVGCTETSISLSGHDSSFSFGLLEAAAMVAMENTHVLLVACDVPPPYPLSEKRGVTAPFAVALLLGPPGSADRLAGLRLCFEDGGREDHLADPALECLRTGNPAARSLPLLQAIARRKTGQVALAHSASRVLCVELEP